MFNPSKYQQAIREFVVSGRGNAIVNAVAGSGKTSTLVYIAEAFKGKACFLAFNKSIAEELKKRLPPTVESRTIHSLAFGAIMQSYKGTKVDENKYRILAKELVADESDIDEDEEFNVASELKKVADLVRVNLIDPSDSDRVKKEVIVHHDLDLEYEDLCLKLLPLLFEKGRAVAAYTVDFTDMLWLVATDQKLSTKKYDFLAVDEAQDLSPAQLAVVKKAMKLGSRAIFVGDPCQPTGTLIRRTLKRGDRWSKPLYAEVPIENLKIGDSVVTASLRDSSCYHNGIIEGITKRFYSDELIIASTPDGLCSKYTINHHCLASFHPFIGQYALYVMSKGNQFRIGTSRVSEQPTGMGPLNRFLVEQADAIWILAFYKTKDEARTMEQAVGGKFGIPQLVFSSVSIKTVGLVEKAWNFIGDNSERAVECLSFFGRNINYPLFTSKDENQRSFKRPQVVYACNLIDGCLMLKHNTDGVHFNKSFWVPVSLSREQYEGDVYSLTVSPNHFYVADGIITHNCQAINAFAGADCNSFDRIKEDLQCTELPLSICYRCPTSHLDLARQIVPQIEARPDAPEGIIRHINEDKLMAEVKEGDMIICRVNAPLLGIALNLIGQGIPARVKGRDIGTSLIATVKKVAKPKKFDWSTFIPALHSWEQKEMEKILRKNNGDSEDPKIQALNDRISCVEAIYSFKPFSSLKEFQSVVDDLFSDERPSVWLSSVHRAKGLENDRIFILHPELLPPPWVKPGTWQAEQESNIRYVAYSRSKSELIFVKK